MSSAAVAPATTMYSLPPIQEALGPVELPTRMYRLPPILGDYSLPTAGGGPVVTSSGQPPSAAASLSGLEARQERILARLSELQGRVATARKELGLRDGPSPAAASNSVSSCAASSSSSSSRSYITATSLSSEGPDGGLSPMDSKRKDVLLGRIADIKATLEELRAVWKAGGTASARSNPEAVVPVSAANLCDLVVHANPDNPPYSLCCLLEDLAKRPDTSVESSSHCHSSIADPIGGLADFLPASALAGAGGGKNLRIRIIWKEMGKEPQVSVGSRVICGEANVARLLARAFPEAFSYDSVAAPDPARDARADECMDRAYSAVVYGSAADHQMFFADLETTLAVKKGGGVAGGKGLGVADYVVWSLLVKSGHNVATPNLRRWAAACRAASGGRVQARTRKSTSGRDQSGKRNRRRSSRKASENGSKGRRQQHGGGGGSTRGPRRKSSGGGSPQVTFSGGKEDAEKRRRAESLLAELGIPFEATEHPPARTMDDLLAHVGHLQGAKCKNFFLRDKRKKLFVLTAPHDAKVDLQRLGPKVGAKDLRFAPEELLREKLGVEPGCLTPFALANDPRREVTFLAEASLLDGRAERLLLHPLVNTATLSIPAAGLATFLKHVGHEAKPLDLS